MIHIYVVFRIFLVNDSCAAKALAFLRIHPFSKLPYQAFYRDLGNLARFFDHKILALLYLLSGLTQLLLIVTMPEIGEGRFS